MKFSGIYIHIPFCKKKCNYCDYYSLENRNSYIDVFIKMLLREIELTAKKFDKDWIFDTIYFGGGSPGLLPSKEIDEILNKLHNQFNTAECMEVTLEINPDETTKDKLLFFKKSGVNRLSIGFQSLEPKLLHTLSRTHNPDECNLIYNHARDSGFDNISIDMLYNIPGQSVESWLQNLAAVTALQPDHIATYPLIIDERAPFNHQVKSGGSSPVSEEIEQNMFIRGSQFLRENGYIQYEIAHFSQLGKECKHNLHYWNLEPYLAFGPSAHSYDGVKRWWNNSSIDAYLRSLSNNEIPPYGFETLNAIQYYNEKIIWGLRTKQGIQIDMLQNIDIKSRFESILKKWENSLEISNKTIRIKSGHYYLADEITSDMMI
jgi:oxygen-independent coproporphyrinogen-3 oxidase